MNGTVNPAQVSRSAGELMDMAREFSTAAERYGAVHCGVTDAAQQLAPIASSPRMRQFDGKLRTVSVADWRGRYGVRVNTISAGPLASRAASAIGIIEKMVEYCAANSPLPEPLTAAEVANAAAFLSSPLASGITGATVYVDKGYHAMGMAAGGTAGPKEP